MNGAVSAVGPTAIYGLAFAIFILIVLVLRTKIHPVLALVIAASISGMSAGMAPDAVVKSITTGFGATLSTIGLVIGMGVMMGRILEVSGAAEKLAYSLIRVLGKGKEEWALAGAGFVISIPIFVDSAFVILQPLVRSLARTSGRSILTLGIALAGTSAGLCWAPFNDAAERVVPSEVRATALSVVSTGTTFGVAAAAGLALAAVAFAESLGKTTTDAEDFPAFIVNRILVPMMNEAIFALYEGVGNVASIDKALKLGANHPMGPLELADFIGLDTCLAIMHVLYDGLADSKYRPCPLLVKYVEAGWLGRKTKRGFYDYRGETPVPTR